MLLESKETIKDLRVIIDNKLKFTDHLKYIKNKCYRLINMFFKIFNIKNKDLYCKLYKIYIRTLILYGLPLYSTNTSYCLNAIENVKNILQEGFIDELTAMFPNLLMLID